MKIALLTDSFIPAPNGTSISVEILRRSLEAAGHEPWVIAPEYKSLKIKERKIISLPGIFSVRDQFQPKVWPISSPSAKVIREAGFQLLHSHHFFKPYNYANSFAKTAGIPHIATFYRHFPEYESKKNSLVMSSPFQNSVKQTLNVANNTNRLIALSSESKSYFEELGVSTPINIIPVGIFTKDYTSYPPQAVRRKFRIPSERKLLLFVGRLEEDANLEFLLKSFKAVWKALDDVHLLIIGGGSKEDELRNIIARQAFADYTTITGFLPKSQVNKIYGVADLFVCPKTLDPQPLSVLESLASGTPVVAVQGCGISDFVKHNQTGLVTSLDTESFSKAITELLRRDSLRLDFSIKARMYSKEFRASNSTHFLLELYESLIDSKEDKLF